MKRALLFTLFVFVGLVVGLPLGRALGHRSFDHRYEAFSDALALAEYETLTTAQYKLSDRPHARDALVDLLNFMDQMETKHRGDIQKAIDLDRGVTYMRLALLEEKLGNAQQAKSDIENARESVKKRDGKDVSTEKLRELVMKYDATPQYQLPGTFLLSRGVSHPASPSQ